MTRTSIALAAATLSLAACSSSGGSASAPAFQPPAGTTVPQSAYVVPTFAIVTSPASPLGTARVPNFVSPGTTSVTITLTSTNPAVAGLTTPISVTTPITAANCTAATPCLVQGPPSPPGVADSFTVGTFTSAPGSTPAPLQLGTASITYTPTAGVANVKNLVIVGIPATVAFTLVQGTAGTALTPTTIAPVVKDASGAVIGGTYASPITVTSSDTKTSGLTLTGGNPASTCTASGCSVTLTGSGDSFTESYGGLAEAPQTVSYSGGPGLTAGSVSFAPTLAAIVHVSGPTSASAGTPIGIDLYTQSGTGSTGAETYSEPGYTGSYGNTLVTYAPACPFATVVASTNANGTTFTATENGATPMAGVCTYTVGDGGLHTGVAQPTFVVTYETSGLAASSSARH